MGRKPAKQPKHIQLAFRIDDETAKALDREIGHEMTARPGLSLNRSDIVRMLMAEALAARAKARK